ncbi:MAG: T9SS type A sorting domain-containing protein [Calditrichia bacterium]
MRSMILAVLFLGFFYWLDAAVSTDQKVNKPVTSTRANWGPDTYGYTAKDNLAPGGPAVNWIDISSGGFQVTGLGDDNIVGPFFIGFPFRYYWYDVTEFYVGSNGYIRFSGAGQLSHPFSAIPNTLPPNDVVCFYTADFDPSTGGAVHYWSNFNDTLIVSFENVPAWNTTGPTGSHSFQVILSMVDTSITFNYGPQTGAFFDDAGMVGIENVAGDIGIECYNTNAIPANYAIKFYYPQSSSYAVHDIGVQRVQNDISGGFFIEEGGAFQPNATLQNTGNQNEGDFYAVAELKSYPAGTIHYSDSVWVDTLEAGETFEAMFPSAWVVVAAGDYTLNVRTTLAGDMVTSNDEKQVELHAVALPGELYFDDNSSENLWTWSGGQGGMAVRYVPPVYPVKVNTMAAYLGTGTLPVMLQLYDDDGPNGEPGTLLISRQLSAASEGWYFQMIADSNIVINDGAVYMTWMMTGDGSSGIGIDENSIGSRQAWEYTGVWATFRDNEIHDPLLRIEVEMTDQVVFEDDFESGSGNWTGDWALTTAVSHSPSNSFTDSPGGNYPSNANLIGAMAAGVDLSSFFGATLEFYTKYELETGFDYCYLEASDDGGSTWYHLKTYNGEGVVTTFTREEIDMGAFAGKADVRIRFRLVSDGGYETDGMYVDDVKIIGLTEDNSPPHMVYNPPMHYQGVPDSFYFAAKITDLSGVADVSLTYWIDDVLPTQYTIQPYNVSNDSFYFVIPPYQAGSTISYFLEATDNAAMPNTVISDTMKYIAGYHMIYDDGDPEYIVELAPSEKIATRITTPAQYTELAAVLLRIYTDSSHPLDSITVHVWADNGGVLGADLVSPFKVMPQSTVVHPEAWTVVDLRSMNLQPGTDFWVGYQLPATLGMSQLYDSPAVYNRSMRDDGTGWSLFSGDFHIRTVMGMPPSGIEPPLPKIPQDFALQQNYPNPFNPATTIPYALPERSEISIEIYNILGSRVAIVKSGIQAPGFYRQVWNSAGFSSGVYLYRLTAKGLASGRQYTQVRKLILMK